MTSAPKGNQRIIPFLGTVPFEKEILNVWIGVGDYASQWNNVELLMLTGVPNWIQGYCTLRSDRFWSLIIATFVFTLLCLRFCPFSPGSAIPHWGENKSDGPCAESLLLGELICFHLNTYPAWFWAWLAFLSVWNDWLSPNLLGGSLGTNTLALLSIPFRVMSFQEVMHKTRLIKTNGLCIRRR